MCFKSASMAATEIAIDEWSALQVGVDLCGSIIIIKGSRDSKYLVAHLL